MSDPRLRQLPFPHEHVVTFDSDVDRQLPWHGAAIHHFLNERLGLNISDSCWVQGLSNARSSFFRGANALNDAPSAEGGHPVYALLLREWHRGNIDHFHSWTSDETHALVNPVEAEFDGASRIAVNLPPVHERVARSPYEHLRLVFSPSAPSQFRLALHDSAGGSLTLTAGDTISVYRQPSTEAVEFLLPDTHRSERRVRLAHLARLEIHVPRREARDRVLVRLERDNFSRASVELQKATLEHWSVLPVYASSHGGRTGAQNFGESRQLDPSRSPVGDDPTVSFDIRPQADEPDAVGYHVDLLCDIGVRAVWPQLWSGGQPWVKAPGRPQPVPPFNGWNEQPVYAFWRTRYPVTLAQLTDEDDFVQQLAVTVPGLSSTQVRAFYREAPATHASNGAMAGLLVATSLAHIASGQHVQDCWYNHFGTVRDARPEAIDRDAPFLPASMRAFQHLAAAQYGTASEHDRVWAPAIGTLVRFKIAMKHASDHIDVDPGGTVRVRPWLDPITGATVPEEGAGTRDLHGLTIYVPAAEQARVFVADREIESFTRNPRDATGRESVTLVDDSAVTPLLDRVPLSAGGEVHIEHGRLTELEHPVDAAETSAAMTLRAEQAGTVALHWRPRDCHLWNTTHLALRWRLKTTNGSQARFLCRLHMQRGYAIAVAEHERDVVDDDAHWIVRGDGGGAWTHMWLALDQLKFLREPTDEAVDLPLPRGRVAALTIAVIEASNGDFLEVDRLWALRPAPGGYPRDGLRLVAGRVDAGDATNHTTVIARWAETTARTSTDELGYYALRVPPGRVVELEARTNDGDVLTPIRGRWLDIRKDEAEVDFQL